MHINKLLKIIQKLAQENDLSTPYIVGGLPRDKIMGLTAKEVKDIDITTGDTGSFSLAALCKKEWPEANFKAYSDKHSSLRFSNITIDFSSNFKALKIKSILEKMKIKDITDLKEELYSRDFTINTLLQPFDISKEPLDLTHMGLKDIQKGLIRTPINPKITIKSDPKRILRAVKLMIKFNMKMVPSLEETIIKYRGLLKDLPLNHIKVQINNMLKFDTKKTIELLSKYKLLPLVPLSKMMTVELAKNHMVQYLFDNGV